MMPLLVNTSSGLVRSSSEGLLLSGHKPAPRPTTASAADLAARTAPFQLEPGAMARPRPPTAAAVMRLTKRAFEEARAAVPAAELQMPKSASSFTLLTSTALPEELKRALRGPKPREPAMRTGASGSAARELEGELHFHVHVPTAPRIAYTQGLRRGGANQLHYAAAAGGSDHWPSRPSSADVRRPPSRGAVAAEQSTYAAAHAAYSAALSAERAAAPADKAAAAHAAYVTVASKASAKRRPASASGGDVSMQHSWSPPPNATVRGGEIPPPKLPAHIVSLLERSANQRSVRRAQLGPEHTGPSIPPDMRGSAASLPAGLSGALAHLVPEVRRHYLAMLETGGQGSNRLHKSLGKAAALDPLQMQMPNMGVTVRTGSQSTMQGTDPVLKP